MKRILLFLLGLTISVSAAADVGQAIFNITVAQLPATCTPSRPYWVTDGDTGIDCIVGGGSEIVQCVCDAAGTGYNGAPVGPGAVSGIGVDGRITRWSGTNTLTSSSSAQTANGLSLNQQAILLNTASPSSCASALAGAIYFDTNLSEPCFCNGTNWLPTDGSGTCDAGAAQNWTDSGATQWTDSASSAWTDG